MGREEFKFKAKEDTDIYYYRWLMQKESSAKGVILLLHGMAEHSLRYGEFANYLNQHGFIVYAPDHRGHGKTGIAMDRLGYFGKDGWDLPIDDIHILLKTIKSNHVDLPVILFGHSMGSILARTCVSEYGSEFDGVVLSGTSNGVGSFTRKFGLGFSKLVSKIHGPKKKSPFLQVVFFGRYNSKFGLDSPVEWLTRDKDVIKEYIDDDLCGFICTGSFYADMLDGINRNAKIENVKKVPSDLPMYIFSGTMDPVGNYTKDVKETYRLYKEVANLEDVKIKLYKDARHEMLNELNKEEVYDDVLKWVQHVFSNFINKKKY